MCRQHTCSCDETGNAQSAASSQLARPQRLEVFVQRHASVVDDPRSYFEREPLARTASGRSSPARHTDNEAAVHA
jgi:hypothetical protein